MKFMLKPKLQKMLNNDYMFNMVNKIYTILIGLISTAFITRYLGVELKGDFAYIMQIIQIATLILNFGIYQSYAYNYKNNNNRNIFQEYSNLYKVQFFIYLILSLISAIFHQNGMVLLVQFTIIIEIAKLQFENVMLVENIRLKIKVNMITKGLVLLLYMIVFISFESSIIYPIMIIIFIDLITLITYIKKMNISISINKVNIQFLKSVIKFGFFPMLSALLVTLNYGIDIIFLKHLSDSINLGLYAAAAGIVNYVWIIPDTFKEVLFSRVGRKNSMEPVILSIKISILGILFIIGIFVLFGKMAIAILYGKEFLESYLVAIILFFGALSMVFFKILGVVFLVEGRRYFYFIVLLLSVIINCLLNFYTIPEYGMYGAALSSVVSYTICGISFLLYFCSVKNISAGNLIFLNFKEFKELITLMRK